MTDRVIFVCTIIIAVVYLYATTLIPSLEIGDPLGPKAFPRLLGIALLLAAALFAFEMWRARKAAGGESKSEEAPFEGHVVLVLGLVAVWTAIYYAVFQPLGYVLATSIYLLALMAWYNRGKWLANVLSSVLFAAGSYYMFVVLDVNLPKGPLPF